MAKKDLIFKKIIGNKEFINDTTDDKFICQVFILSFGKNIKVGNKIIKFFHK